MNKKLLFSIIAVLVLLLLCGAGVGGWFGYQKWYLPKMAEEFISETEDDLSSVDGISIKVSKNVQNIFSSDVGNDSIGALEQDNEIIDEAYNLAHDLATKAKSAKESIPSSNLAVSNMDKDLTEYYKDAVAVGEEYKDHMAFYQEIQELAGEVEDIMDEVSESNFSSSSSAEALKSAQRAHEFADGLVAFGEELSEIETDSEFEEKQIEIYAEQFNIVADYVESLAQAYEVRSKDVTSSQYRLEALRIVSESQSQFSDEVDESNEKQADLDKEIREHYTKKFDKLQEQHEDIEKEISKMEEDYNLGD